MKTVIFIILGLLACASPAAAQCNCGCYGYGYNVAPNWPSQPFYAVPYIDNYGVGPWADEAPYGYRPRYGRGYSYRALRYDRRPFTWPWW